MHFPIGAKENSHHAVAPASPHVSPTEDGGPARPSPARARPRRLRLFSSPRHRPRKRRPTDLALLALAPVAAAMFVVGSQPPSGFESALIDLAASIPSALDVLWKILAGLQLGWAVPLVILTIIRWRLDVVRDLLLAAIDAGALAIGIDKLWLGGTLAIVLSALHSPVSLGTLLVINVCVTLFAGVMPVTGGIGVTEGALIFGLTAAGVDQGAAFAATICYRLITFYLPPLWGGATFHHMERTGLL